MLDEWLAGSGIEQDQHFRAKVAEFLTSDDLHGLSGLLDVRVGEVHDYHKDRFLFSWPGGSAQNSGTL